MVEQDGANTTTHTHSTCRCPDQRSGIPMAPLPIDIRVDPPPPGHTQPEVFMPSRRLTCEPATLQDVGDYIASGDEEAVISGRAVGAYGAIFAAVTAAGHGLGASRGGDVVEGEGWVQHHRRRGARVRLWRAQLYMG